MIKDIDFKKTEHIVLAAVPDEEDNSENWKVLLVNLSDHPLENVLVSSKGFGEKDDKQVETTDLRQHFEAISANDAVTVELITPELKEISNQFWISYWFNGNLHDKKFVFLSESIVEENMINVPVIGKRGVVLK